MRQIRRRGRQESEGRRAGGRAGEEIGGGVRGLRGLKADKRRCGEEDEKDVMSSVRAEREREKPGTPEAKGHCC